MDELFVVEGMTLWLIIPAFIFYLITGYGFTRNLLPKSIALYLHIIACGFFAALVLLHLLGRMRCMLGRNKIRGSKVDAVLFIIGVIVLALLVYVEMA